MPDFERSRLRPLPSPYSGLVADDFKQTSKGAVWLFVVAPGVLYTQGAGHWDLGIAERFTVFGHGHFAPGQPWFLVHDWIDLTGYDTQARKYLTQWVIDNRTHLKEIHALVRSPLVAMGVEVVNVVTSTQGVDVHSYRDRAAFDKVLPRTLETARRTRGHVGHR